jgi:cytochrome c553
MMLVLVACAGSSQRTPATSSTTTALPGDGERDRSLALHMGNYFWMVLEARDALIAGSLGRARSRMRRLSEQKYGALVPASWLPDMDRMAGEAARVAAARDLREASEALAGVAVACGACHARLHAGPLPDATPVGGVDGQGEDVEARMLRHQWAADALWSGLSRPSDSDWRAGAEALVEAPLSLPEGLGGESQQAAIERVRDIGRDALAAMTPGRRAGVYAALLQSCSGCHGKF